MGAQGSSLGGTVRQQRGRTKGVPMVSILVTSLLLLSMYYCFIVPSIVCVLSTGLTFLYSNQKIGHKFKFLQPPRVSHIAFLPSTFWFLHLVSCLRVCQHVCYSLTERHFTMAFAGQYRKCLHKYPFATLYSRIHLAWLLKEKYTLLTKLIRYFNKFIRELL